MLILLKEEEAIISLNFIVNKIIVLFDENTNNELNNEIDILSVDFRIETSKLLIELKFYEKSIIILKTINKEIDNISEVW